MKPDDLLLAHLNLEAGIHLLRDGNVDRSKPYLDAAYSQYRKQIAANDSRLLIAALWMGKYQPDDRKPRVAEPFFNQVLTAPGDGTEPRRARLARAVGDRLRATRRTRKSHAPLHRGRPLDPWKDEVPPALYEGTRVSGGRERSRGLSAVEFTIDASGFVRDSKLVETQAATRSATGLDAVTHWRYAPRISDGTPLDTAGVQAKVDFKLTP